MEEMPRNRNGEGWGAFVSSLSQQSLVSHWSMFSSSQKLPKPIVLDFIETLLHRHD